MKVVMRYKEPGQLSSQATQARVPVACVISICIRLGCAPRAFLGRENAAEHDGNARLRQKRVVS